MRRGVYQTKCVLAWMLLATLFTGLAGRALCQPPPRVDLNISGPTRFDGLSLPSSGLIAYDEVNGVALRVVVRSLSVLPAGRIEGLADIEMTGRSADGLSLEWRPMFVAIPMVGNYFIKIYQLTRHYDLITDGFDPGYNRLLTVSESFTLRGAVPNAAFSVRGRMVFVQQGQDTEHTSRIGGLIVGHDGLAVFSYIAANNYRAKGLTEVGAQPLTTASFESTNSTLNHTWAEYIRASGDAVVQEESGATYPGGVMTMSGVWYKAHTGIPGKIAVNAFNPTTGYRGQYTAWLGSTQSEAISMATADGLAFPNVDELETLSTREMFVAPSAATTTLVDVWTSPVYKSWLQELDNDRP